jgi:hypothetical protein
MSPAVRRSPSSSLIAATSLSTQHDRNLVRRLSFFISTLPEEARQHTPTAQRLAPPQHPNGSSQVLRHAPASRIHRPLLTGRSFNLARPPASAPSNTRSLHTGATARVNHAAHLLPSIHETPACQTWTPPRSLYALICPYNLTLPCPALRTFRSRCRECTLVALGCIISASS